MPESFDTIEDAAMYALRQAIPMSGKYEYAGAIYEKDGKFYYTTPETSNEKHGVKVRVAYPKGGQLMGLYHTHPEGGESELFSPHDIDVATQLSVPYFMGNYSDGAMSVFRPGESEVQQRRRRGRRSGYRSYDARWSSGELLGNAFEGAERESSD